MDDISLNDIFLFLMILLGVCAVVWIFVAIIRGQQNASNALQPVRKEWAKVVDKQQIPPNAIIFEIWVMFELKNGQRLRLLAKAKNSLIIGDEGMLTWQGNKLQNFERNLSKS